MADEDLLLAEVRRLRAETVALRATLTTGRNMHSWARHIVKDFETNPRTQYKVHLWGSMYWLVNLPMVCYLFFGQPALWTKLGIFITLVYSIYANFATDYGAMSAAMAAFGQQPLPEIPAEIHPATTEPGAPKS